MNDGEWLFLIKFSENKFILYYSTIKTEWERTEKKNYFFINGKKKLKTLH